MKRLLFTGIVLLSAFNTYAQYTFKASIRKYEENVPLAGATVTWKEHDRSAAVDSTGLAVINNIPAGLQTFINFENFTDTRQTKWELFYTGSAITPVFTEVYAPIDGFIFNGGIKIKL